GTHREIHWKLAEGIGSLSGVRRKIVEGISSLSRVHREHAKDDREHARMMSGVRWKKTKRFAGRSSGVVEKLAGSQEGLVGLDGHIDCRQLYCRRPIFRVGFGGCTACT
ncbi:hypothetical protein BHE74_00052441, partial [Ensete ventricosum]